MESDKSGTGIFTNALTVAISGQFIPTIIESGLITKNETDSSLKFGKNHVPRIEMMVILRRTCYDSISKSTLSIESQREGEASFAFTRLSQTR